MAHSEIHVYASLPLVVSSGVDISLSADKWHWVRCLTLPLETLKELQFSSKPYKWIRYAMGSIIGAEGELSSSSELLDIVDYSAGLPAESATLYYYIGDDEIRRIFPADPNFSRTHATSSAASAQVTRFYSEVAERDRNQCLLAGTHGAGCDAVHLLAHSKGDSYITAYTQRRSRDGSDSNLVYEIDSVRNGLFLNKITHAALGQDTPNFAMNTADVDPTVRPEENRYTVHLFDPSRSSMLLGVAPGTPLRTSGADTWPPAILFDAVYASAVLHHFGTHELKNEVSTNWMHTFYPEEIKSREQVGHKQITKEETKKQEQERQQRHTSRTAPDTLDILLHLPFMSVPPEKRQAMLKEAEEQAHAAERRSLEEKIESWNKKNLRARSRTDVRAHR